MSTDNSHIINLSDNYIHLKSDVVPDWVKNLEVLKLKIRAQLESSDENTIEGIRFCSPIDVPDSKKQ